MFPPTVAPWCNLSLLRIERMRNFSVVSNAFAFPERAKRYDEIYFSVCIFIYIYIYYIFSLNKNSSSFNHFLIFGNRRLVFCAVVATVGLPPGIYLYPAPHCHFRCLRFCAQVRFTVYASAPKFVSIFVPCPARFDVRKAMFLRI